MSDIIEKHVFLTSSLKETKSERNRITRFFTDLRTKLHSVKFHFHNCQTTSNSVKTDKQEDYNQMIKESDFLIVIIKENLYEYSKEEVETAIKSFLENGKPQILICYHKDCEKKDEIHSKIEALYQKILNEKMKHQKILIEKFKYLPCSVYQYEDEILYQILLLFNEHMQDSFKINIVGNDQIQINDEEPLTREVFDLNKIPLYQRDQTLIRLQKAFSDKQAEIERYEKEHPADYSSVYQQLKDDLQQLSQEIQAQRMRFLDVTLNLSRKNFPYKEDLEKFILEEQKENAYRILEAINQARQEEIQAAELMQIAIRDKAKATVEEIFQCIHICKERYSDGKLEEQVLALYDIADEWILKFGLDRSKMIEKIEVLKDNNKNLDALIYADELLLHLTKENTPVSKLALLYNLKGNLCYRMRGHWLPLAEIYYLQGIDLIKEIKSETYRLSILYSDLGIYYKELYATSEKDLEKAAVYLSKAKTAHNEALRLKKDLLDTCDPNDEKQKLQYQARYAISLNAMGDISYYQSKQQTESKKTELLEESLEIYYKKAYEIRKEILEKTKKEGKRVAARAYIVRSTINIARSYVELYIHENHSEPCHLQAADHYSQEALSIISELYQSNQSINVQIAFCGCNPYPRRYLKGNR